MSQHVSKFDELWFLLLTKHCKNMDPWCWRGKINATFPKQRKLTILKILYIFWSILSIENTLLILLLSLFYKIISLEWKSTFDIISSYCTSKKPLQQQPALPNTCNYHPNDILEAYAAFDFILTFCWCEDKNKIYLEFQSIWRHLPLHHLFPRWNLYMPPSPIINLLPQKTLINFIICWKSPHKLGSGQHLPCGKW